MQHYTTLTELKYWFYNGLITADEALCLWNKNAKNPTAQIQYGLRQFRFSMNLWSDHFKDLTSLGLK